MKTKRSWIANKTNFKIGSSARRGNVSGNEAMTQEEREILRLLKSFLDGEINFLELDNKWIEVYIEDDSNIDYQFEDSFHEIAEFIYWGSDKEPSLEEKSYGVLSSAELKNKIRLEMDKNKDWETKI